MDIYEWWSARLESKRQELEKFSAVTLGSIVDKLRSTISRLDLVHQIALLERNIAREDVESVTRKLQSLLAVIHQDDGRYARECGLDASVEGAILRLQRERAKVKLPEVPAPASHETVGDPPIRIPRLGLACEDGCDEQLVRASGDVLCEPCGKPYRLHPYCRGQVTMMTGVPEYFLHVDCEGRHLKL